MPATQGLPAGGGGTGHAGASPLWTFTEILLGILGVICLVMGIVILVAGDEQSVGLGGDLTWQVGAIPIAVAVGLLIGGVALLAVMVAMAVATRGGRVGRVGPQVRSRQELLAHATAFVIVNGFLWLQDIIAGGGLEYAWLTTLPWGIGLIAHALAYYSGRNRSQGRPTR